MLEVCFQIRSIDGLHLVVDHRHASLQRSVDAVEGGIVGAEDAVGDLDRRRQRRRHDAFDRRRIRGRDAATVAGTVDVRRENAERY